MNNIPPVPYINLPVPLSPQNAGTWKRLIEQADAQNLKANQDIIIGATGRGTQGKGRLILVDPSGGRWNITVDTSGAISATAVP